MAKYLFNAFLFFNQFSKFKCLKLKRRFDNNEAEYMTKHGTLSTEDYYKTGRFIDSLV